MPDLMAHNLLEHGLTDVTQCVQRVPDSMLTSSSLTAVASQVASLLDGLRESVYSVSLG